MSALEAKIGLPAPPFSGLCADGSFRSLEDYRGGNLVLVFHRQLESRPCREHLRRLWLQRGVLARLDTSVLVVSFEPIDRIRWYLTDVEFGFPMLSDVHRHIYHSYGLGRAGVARDLFRPHLPSSLSALARHGPEPHHADAHQTGGDFVIDAAGTIRSAYRPAGAGGRPPIDELILDLRRIPARA